MNTQAIKASIIQGRGREKPSRAVHRAPRPETPDVVQTAAGTMQTQTELGRMRSARGERCRTADKATQTCRRADEIARRIRRDVLYTSGRVSGQNLSLADFESHRAGDANYRETMERNCKSSSSSVVGNIFLCLLKGLNFFLLQRNYNGLHLHFSCSSVLT